MAVSFIYDIDNGVFITEQGLTTNVTPAIYYGTRPVWNLYLRHGNGTIPDLSEAIAFRAAIDTDFNSSTTPILRTLSGITYTPATGCLRIPLDSRTQLFQQRCNGRQRLNAYFEVHGSNSDGDDVFYIIFRCACCYVIDPDGAGAISPSTGTAMTQAEVAAIVSQVLQEQAATLQGPPGPAAPATLFQFSADAANWHSDWSAGDTYLRISANNGASWQTCQLVPAASTLPVARAWQDNTIYAAGEIVSHGSPATLYQATARIADFTEPGTADAAGLWLPVCEGRQGETGPAGATWLTGDTAPSQYNTAGQVGDHYLDLSNYNHYLLNSVGEVQGTPIYVWTQQGSLKGADGTGINYRGAWDSEAAYHVGDAVTYHGSLWRAYKASTAYPPPTDPNGESPCWQIFLAAIKGEPGAAGTIEIAQIIIEDPSYTPFAQELNWSNAAHRAYALHLPRGSAGPAGQTTFHFNDAPSEDDKVHATQDPASTPYNRIYYISLPRGRQGETGKGLKIDYVGAFEERILYDTANPGETFLATDLLEDDHGQYYQAIYYKTADGWSDAVRLYMGAPGKDGEKGEKGDSTHGLAPAREDHEFTATELVANALYLDGDMPIASVELLDSNGDYTALHPGQDYAVRTSIALGKTIIYFGAENSLDFTYGGRIRYAQGKVAESITLASLAQYSADGTTWHASPASGDLYVRLSLDNGDTWGPAIQLQLPAATTGIQDAPSDGKFYARRNGQWVEITPCSCSNSGSGSGSGNEPETTAASVIYGHVPYAVAGSISNVSQLTSAMLEDQGTDSHTATAEATGNTAFGTCPAGSWLYVLVPASSGLVARKFDGVSSYVAFGTGVPVADTEANGTSFTLDGTAYRLYGEWVSTAAAYSFNLTTA